MEYLMYTDIPVIKIAMNNGFASVAAFDKVFKETYQEDARILYKEAITRNIEKGRLMIENDYLFMKLCVLYL